MEPNQLDALIKSLGFDPVQVGEWATLLVAWRLVFKIASGWIQGFLEDAINKALSTRDSRIMSAVSKVINSLPYIVTAWMVDAVLSVKLPLNIEPKDGSNNPAQKGP